MSVPAQDPQYVGWHDAPNERGTITLLWTCLSTIIISTWTILHLNVPGRNDTTVQKVIQKIRWMGATILFPEITFAKAVCELQMAVEDLFLLRDIEKDLKKTGWKVEVGWVAHILYWLFHPLKSQDNAPPEAKNISNELQRPELVDQKEGIGSGPEEPRRDGPSLTRKPIETTWTLTHSYFANMGGIRIARTYSIFPVTTFVLAKCCARTKDSLFPHLSINKADIEDKSKANWLTKSIAISQISWLVISVCARKARSLTISQIEICTVAFAVLATATWLANWYKPKDVDRPITIDVDGMTILDEESIHIRNIYEESYRRLSKVYHDSGQSPRDTIRNDYIRFDINSPTAAYLIAISTTFFGGIHLLAWNSEFPSHVEATIWRMAGVLTTAIPLVSIILIGLNSHITNRQTDNMLSALKKEFADSSNTENLFQNNEALPDNYQEEFLDWSEFPEVKTRQMYCRWLHEACRGVFGSGNSYHHLFWFFVSWEYLISRNPEFLLKFKLSAKQTPTLRDELQFLINMINGVNGVNGKKLYKIAKTKYDTLKWRKEKISQAIMIITGFLYSVFRLMMLAVALAALRHQDERLYLDTWTKNLPNIS